MSLILAKLKAIFTSDAFTGGVAISAITSKLWLPSLTDLSHIATELLPIGGFLLILLQGFYIIKRKGRK
jgi:hypothetical protein